MIKNLLLAILQGYPKHIIARMSGVSLDRVNLLETEGKHLVSDAIHRMKKNGVPLVGGA